MASPPGKSARDFEAFRASELFCPRCRIAMPVREFLLLVLPDGDLYEYRCTACGELLGKRSVQRDTPAGLIVSSG